MTKYLCRYMTAPLPPAWTIISATAYRDVERGVFRASDQVAAYEDGVALLNHGGELGVADWQNLIGCLCPRILCDGDLHAKRAAGDYP